MREDGLLARKLSLPSVDGDFTRAMNNNSSSSSRWNSGSSFCDGDRREGMKTKPKRKRKALCCAWLFLSFTPTPQLLTVGCVMCTQEKRSRVSVGGRSVMQTTSNERLVRALAALVLLLLLVGDDYFIDLFAPCWPVLGTLSCSLLVCAQQRSRHLAAVPELAIALLFLLWNWPVGSSC